MKIKKLLIDLLHRYDEFLEGKTNYFDTSKETEKAQAEIIQTFSQADGLVDMIKDCLLNFNSDVEYNYRTYDFGKRLDRNKELCSTYAKQLAEQITRIQFCEYCKMPFYANYRTARCPDCVKANYGKEIIEED